MIYAIDKKIDDVNATVVPRVHRKYIVFEESEGNRWNQMP